VEHFLFTSRRGADYQFATATAVMLRSLGYAARLVGGFYVSPERYDPRKQHTPVTKDDAHVWLEVFHMGRTWLTVEPTPGYEVLQPPPTWWDQVQQAAATVARLAQAWWPLVVLAVVLLGLGWRQRTWFLDRLCVWWWRMMPARDLRGRALQTLRAVEYRLQLHRRARPAGVPPAEWFRRVELPTDAARRSLLQLAQLADWAAYAPPSVRPPTHGEHVWAAALAAVGPCRGPSHRTDA
jgi:hypothetical protein